ncbi:phage tail protein [Pseudomonas sp. SP16.1]|uniref:phage tail protein n=1 Tax=Pseudomonas sp. SP16.1 TaxID=3458854 RepID=UPI00404571B4
MSSGGQIAGAVVGGIVGFVVAGPAGALQGAALGSGIGAALDPPKGPTVHGPRLSDLTFQTSTYGAFLPRFYGTAPAHGNVFWLEGGKLKEVVRKKKSGGKGSGSSQTTKTYTYYATFAIGLGEGSIAGVRRIWCRDKLIYNAGSDDLETIIASNKAAKGWRLYLGTDDQLPDPRIEAEKGVGNTPAYRGTAYIVFDDFELTKYNNSLEGAQFKFEVVSSGAQPKRKLLDRAVAAPVGAGYHVRPLQRQMTSDASLMSFYAYAPSDGITGDIPNSEAVAQLNNRGDYIRNATFPVDVVRPQVVSSGATTVYVGDLGGENLWVPEYASDFPIGSTRQILPLGVITGKDTISVSGSLGDVADALPGESGRYVKGCALSEDGDSIIILTDSSPKSMSATADRYFVVNSELTVVDSGAISGSDRIFALFDNTNIVTGATAFDRHGASVWVVYNIGFSIRVVGYSLAGGVLSQDYFEETTPISSPKYPAIALIDGLLYVLLDYSGNVRWRVYQGPEIGNDTAELSEVVGSEVGMSALLAMSDIDAAALTNAVRGYRVQGGTIRASLENLQSVFPFDVRQHGYQLQCVPRGGASVATIPHEHLGATSGESAADILRQSREMDSQLPASTHLKFWDADREYANGEEYADRPGTEAINRVDREVPIVLTATEAARAVDVLQQLPWLERTQLDFELPPIYGHLEPADVVTVTTPGGTYLLRLTEINDSPDMVRKCKAKPAGAAIYNSEAVGGGGNTPPQTIGLAGPSLFLPLDIPLVDEVSQSSPGFVGVMTGYNNSWPGAIAVRSADGGQTFEDIQAFPGKATVGVSQNALADHAGYLISSATLTLSVISGELESITQDQLLTGYNYAAYGVDGRWEIVRFRDATLNADGTYTLSGFVRGDKGTEWATGLHQVGDYFVLLDDPDNAFIGMSIQSIGLDRIYRGVTSGASLDDADDVTFSYDGVNLEPLSAVNVTGARDGSQNFTGSFYRRSRLSSTWWTNGVQAPVGETTEAYEIDVMNGSSVVRTISSSTTSFSYTAAQQTTDFGSAQASITFRIYQLSEVVGRGYVREVTL